MIRDDISSRTGYIQRLHYTARVRDSVPQQRKSGIEISFTRRIGLPQHLFSTRYQPCRPSSATTIRTRMRHRSTLGQCHRRRPLADTLIMTKLGGKHLYLGSPSRQGRNHLAKRVAGRTVGPDLMPPILASRPPSRPGPTLAASRIRSRKNRTICPV